MFIGAFNFYLDSTSREEHTDKAAGAVNAIDRRNVDLTKNFEPIPVFGDWAGLGHADRSDRAAQA